MQKLHHQFWARWSKEYVQEVLRRAKWLKNTITVQVGMLVIIIEENLPPAEWHLERIIRHKRTDNGHPGQDGTTRLVTLRTATGEVKRAVNKIYVLPIDSDVE